MFSFIRNCRSFPEWMVVHLAFPSAMYEWPRSHCHRHWWRQRFFYPFQECTVIGPLSFNECLMNPVSVHTYTTISRSSVKFIFPSFTCLKMKSSRSSCWIWGTGYIFYVWSFMTCGVCKHSGAANFFVCVAFLFLLVEQKL